MTYVALYSDDPTCEGFPFHRQTKQLYRGTVAQQMGLVAWQVQNLLQYINVDNDGTLTLVWKPDAPKPDPEQANYSRVKP